MRIKSLLACASVALGFLAETALWNHRAGPGWLVFTVLTLLLILELKRRLERASGVWVWLLWGSTLAFSAALALYDGAVLHAVAPWLAGVTLSLAVYWSLAGPSRMEAFGAPGWLLRWADFPFMVRESGGSLRAVPCWTKILQGLVLAVPMVLLFGGLFLMADPNYERQLSQAGVNAGPVLRALLFAFLLLGGLHHYVLRAGAGEKPAPFWQADPTILGVALVCLNALFASFLAVQAEHLFQVDVHPGRVAEYARSGFFELVTATLLVLGLVMAAYAMLYRRNQAGWALGAMALLILQTFGLAGSAVHRMSLYIQSWGLTLTRTYVEMALMGICLSLLLVLAALVRRPELPWLTARLLMLGLLMLAGAGLVDVERLVAEVNVRRPNVDRAYLATLSADAIPAVDPETAALIRAHLEPLDWRTVNLSRVRDQIKLSSGTRR